MTKRMTKSEFLTALGESTAPRRIKRTYSEIRFKGSGGQWICPIIMVANERTTGLDLRPTEYMKAIELLGLRPCVAARIMFAADDPDSPMREQLLTACHL